MITCSVTILWPGPANVPPSPVLLPDLIYGNLPARLIESQVTPASGAGFVAMYANGVMSSGKMEMELGIGHGDATEETEMRRSEIGGESGAIASAQR